MDFEGFLWSCASRRFALAWRNKGASASSAGQGLSQQGGIGLLCQTPNWKHHFLQFETTAFLSICLCLCLRELHCASVRSVLFLRCAHQSVSLYISLFAAGKAGSSEPRDASQPNEGLRVRLFFFFFSMCLLFYECTWALKPSVVQKSHICLCEIEKKRNREREKEVQGCKTDIALIILECHWCLISLCENIRGTITSEDESKNWPAEERRSLIYCIF